MKNTIKLIFYAVFFCIISIPALASKFQDFKNVTINSEVAEDLYLAGQHVTISAPIRGDLICAAGDIDIMDTISNDAILAGGTINITGYIGDDLRLAGGNVTIENDIEGDLIIAAGEVLVKENVIIHGNIRMAGGKLIMNGIVEGQANIRSGEVIWNGTVIKDFNVKTKQLVFNGMAQGTSTIAAEEISLGDEAKFYGAVDYWNAPGGLDFGNSLASGVLAKYNPDMKLANPDFNWQHLGLGLVAFWGYRLLASALIILILIWMFHRFFTGISTETYHNNTSHLGFGFLYVIGLPVIAVITIMTVIGLPVGFLLMFGYGITLALGHVLASLLIAYGLNAYYDKSWNKWNLFLVAICAYLALKILGIIPLAGFLISMIIVSIAFGNILEFWWKSRSNKKVSMVE